MRRFLTCFLALCCAALLVACEWSAVPLEGDKPPVGSPPEPAEITVSWLNTPRGTWTWR